jgi:alpha-beta hydrolase superfamily lysophospholipase
VALPIPLPTAAPTFTTVGAAAAEKVPFHFGPAARPLFGFYHPPTGAGVRGMGVLLCNPIGDDLIRAHRTFRHLAERLSAAGFAALRFDFDGTGDSAGDERDPDRVAAWRADVTVAAAELRARSGFERLALVGLRLGGTFAALGAADLGGVDALVLWSAYDDGKTFVAETTKAHKMHVMLQPMSFSGGPPASDGQEGLGFLLTSQAIADLTGLGLASLSRAPARQTLVLEAGNVARADPIAARLRALGGAVTVRQLPGNKFLVTSPQHAELPSEALSTIAGWLEDQCPTAEGASARPADGPSAVASALGERPVFFGGPRKLFGILATPTTGAARPELPAIILLNAGTAHRVGSHRLYVPLARRWAALGFVVLRVDLSGIGDSPVPAGCRENLTYPRDGLDDVRAAMDLLTETKGVERFIVTGLCSGGDIAFQLGFKEPRVTGTIMMNPRTFLVNDLAMVDAYERARWYQRSATRGASWRKFLRGEVDLARALKLAAPKVKDLVVTRARRAVTDLLGVARLDAAAAARQRETDVPYCLRSMAERGVDTYLFVTEHDPGVDYVDANYGAAMRALETLPSFRRTDVPGTDHTFTARWAQEQVSDLLTEHLTRRYLAARAA